MKTRPENSSPWQRKTAPHGQKQTSPSINSSGQPTPTRTQLELKKPSGPNETVNATTCGPNNCVKMQYTEERNMTITSCLLLERGPPEQKACLLSPRSSRPMDDCWAPDVNHLTHRHNIKQCRSKKTNVKSLQRQDDSPKCRSLLHRVYKPKNNKQKNMDEETSFWPIHMNPRPIVP